jgi:hypothetical protein
MIGANCRDDLGEARPRAGAVCERAVLGYMIAVLDPIGSSLDRNQQR